MSLRTIGKNQFLPAESAEEELHFDLILHQNAQVLLLSRVSDSEIGKKTETLSTTVDFQRSNCGLQRGRGQVGVLVLELAVEGEAPLVLVVG